MAVWGQCLISHSLFTQYFPVELALLIAKRCWGFSNCQHHKLSRGSESLSGIFPPSLPPTTISSAVSTELTVFVVRWKKIGLRQPQLFPGESCPTTPKHRPALFPTSPAHTSAHPTACTNHAGSPRAAPGAVGPSDTCLGD